MENKGGTERESADERRTRFDEREEDGKLREVKGEFVTKRSDLSRPRTLEW
ncbi:hypothetical protein ALC62_02730 [Cyphomyrmex costatus]|uniref:Uncharacterized protein n=1 Tax=Cyphomyrmex costatus TaxID=456900 RepID=A0A195D0J4_9HYME|nr:hypothetical protein ALC62_02730 [Cyphomyrmex costatus]